MVATTSNESGSRLQNDEPLISLKQLIIDICKKNKISLKKLGEKTGANPSTFSKILNGKRKFGSAKTYMILLQYQKSMEESSQSDYQQVIYQSNPDKSKMVKIYSVKIFER